jgi:uncharacterized protein (DUF1810 family)
MGEGISSSRLLRAPAAQANILRSQTSEPRPDMMTIPADDPYDLSRFVEAQDRVYSQVCAELRAGEKRSHWMWFVFPQIAGLGHSPMARRYAISGLDEARAFLRHGILGPRLKACTKLVLAVNGCSARQIFGEIDSQKFRSSMTLFARAAPDHPDFRAAIDRYFAGKADELTLAKLGAG